MSKEKAKKPLLKKWWVWVIAVVVVIAIASSGEEEVAEPANTEVEQANTAVQGEEEDQSPQESIEEVEEVSDDDTTSEEVVEEEVIVEETPAEEELIKVNAGIYEVGTDIEPGLYKSEGSVNYWARLAGFSGELDDILANGNPEGSDVIEILESDKAFETSGSGNWYKLDENYQPEISTSFEDGTYIVGKDIEPGKYKSDGAGTFGYWARTSGFTGDLNEIIANGNPEGPTIVEISESDVGFQTWGNGTWEKMD